MQAFTFEDQGQDFSEIITLNDRIIDVQPFQWRFWAGKRALFEDEDSVLLVAHKNEEPKALKYEVIEVHPVSEGYFHGFITGLYLMSGVEIKHTAVGCSDPEDFKIGRNVGRAYRKKQYVLPMDEIHLSKLFRCSNLKDEIRPSLVNCILGTCPKGDMREFLTEQLTARLNLVFEPEDIPADFSGSEPLEKTIAIDNLLLNAFGLKSSVVGLMTEVT